MSDPLCHYEILRKIAAGGMGEIFLARRRTVGGFAKTVAIKRIRADLAESDETVPLFLQEARIAALLDHPNIVQIHELGREEHGYFIVMEYVPGLSLSRCLKLMQQPLPLEVAFRVAASVAEALDFMHSKVGDDGQSLQLVHRDVSPPNVLLSTSGAVKITDFGIAKFKDSAMRTRAGVIKGKFAYMSPEQVRGERLDARSDIFSLGLILYEMTTGRRAFGGDSADVVRAVEAARFMAPNRVRPDYPDDAAAVVQRALERNPARRYQTARELHSDLLGLLLARRLTTSSVDVARYVASVLEVTDDSGPFARSPSSSGISSPSSPSSPSYESFDSADALRPGERHCTGPGATDSAGAARATLEDAATPLSRDPRDFRAEGTPAWVSDLESSSFQGPLTGAERHREPHRERPFEPRRRSSVASYLVTLFIVAVVPVLWLFRDRLPVAVRSATSAVQHPRAFAPRDANRSADDDGETQIPQQESSNVAKPSSEAQLTPPPDRCDPDALLSDPCHLAPQNASGASAPAPAAHNPQAQPPAAAPRLVRGEQRSP